jgi:hypothetical protein
VKSRMSLSFSAALCLSILMMARPSMAQVEELKPEPPLVRQMLQEGWTKVAEGVLQRNTEGGPVETFTYGEDGLRWTARKMEARLAFLQNEYNAHPSEDLAGLIESLKSQLIELDQNLKSGTAQAEVASPDTLTDCTIQYGANANATYLTGTSAPGTTASANANYSSNCGQLGNTYAYAYARATAGTVTTTKIQEDPKYDGTSLSSAASASAPGGTDCYSEAYARAWSPTLNINYEAGPYYNYSCPAPPPQLYNSVSGPYDVYTDDYTPCQYVTWNASASGGVPGYTYDWYIGGTYQGSGSSLTKRYCRLNSSVTVQSIAHDSIGQNASATFTTYFYYEPSCTSSCACLQSVEDPASSGSSDPQICQYQY